SSLLGGAAVGLALALSLSAGAQAKPVKHHVRHAAAVKADPREEEIQELEAENAALNQRPKDVAAAQQQAQAAAQETQAAAQQAQAAAQASAQQAAAAQAQAADAIKRIPEIKVAGANVEVTDTARTPRPKTVNWWENTSVGGVIFSD